MEKVAYYIYLVVLVISPILFGAVHTWVYVFVSLLILAASLLLLRQNIAKKGHEGYEFRFPKTGMLPLFVGFIVILLLQMTSLPQGLLFWIAPESKVVGGYAVPASTLAGGSAVKDQWLAIAPYLYPVRTSLIQWIVYGLFFFGFVQTLNSRKRIETVILLILCLGVIESLYGIVESFSGHNHLLWTKKSPIDTDVSGTYDSRNHFAGLMEMGIILAVAYAGAFALRSGKEERKSLRKGDLKEKFINFFSTEGFFTRRFLIIFAGVVMSIGLILCKSRGGIIALAIALLFLGIAFFIRKDYRKKGAIILALFLMTSCFALFAGIEKTVERFTEISGSYQDRALITKDTMQMFNDYMVAGVGIGDFRYAYPRYQDVKFQTLSMIYAHNDWAQLLAESGVVGLVSLLAGMGYYLFMYVHRWRKRRNAFSICLGLAALAALVAMAVHSWSDFNLRIPANVLILSAIVAIGFCAVHLETSRRRHHHSPVESYRLPFAKGGAVVLVLWVLLILWTGGSLIRLFVAEAYCPTESNPTLNINALPPEDRIQRAILWDGRNAAYHYKRALVLIKEEDRAAQQQVQDTGQDNAASRDDKKQAIVSSLEEAVHLNPLNAEYHARLAWEYTHLWYRQDYMQKWLPAADISMERAAHVAGDWAENPHLHLDMGNYWVGRSGSLPSEDPKAEIAWTKALWHYQKALSLNKSKAVREEITQFVKSFYRDEAKVKEALGEGQP